MDTPETVIEDAQRLAAEHVADATVVGQTAIASEVAQVADQLAVHQDESEERHEEILEGEAWLKNALSELTLELGSLRESILQIRETLATVLTNHGETMSQLSNLKSSLDTRQSTQRELTPVETVNPEEIKTEVSENGEVQTSAQPEAPPKRRTIKRV